MRGTIFKIDDKAYHARKMRENKGRDRMPQEVIDSILDGMPETSYRFIIREDGQESIINNYNGREIREGSLDSYFKMVLALCRRAARGEDIPLIGVTSITHDAIV